MSPTFEEDKDELEKIEEKNINLNKSINLNNEDELKKNDKVYINLTALDKITAKTSLIRLGVGDKKSFGTLEIKVLKCQISDNEENSDTLAYIQVKDVSENENEKVFIFNGWTFSSDPTIAPFDHAIYDLQLVNCNKV